MFDEKLHLEKVIREDSSWYDKAGWNKVKVSEAKALAKSLGISNISSFVNQVPHMRALLALGKMEALKEFVDTLRASKVCVSYPNTYTYMSTTVSSE